jgi:hypothetical protein
VGGAGRLGQRCEAAQQVRLGAVPLGALARPRKELDGLRSSAHLEQGDADLRVSDGGEPAVVRPLGQRHGPPTVVKGLRVPATQSLQPAQMTGEPAGMQLMTAALADCDRLADPAFGCVPVGGAERCERGLEHRPLEQLRIPEPAQQRHQLGQDAGQLARPPE